MAEITWQGPSCARAFLCYISCMRTVEEIKEAIERLSPQERAELEELLHPRLDHEWDTDLKEAAPAGDSDKRAVKAD
jgi:hypothetical protein